MKPIKHILVMEEKHFQILWLTKLVLTVITLCFLLHTTYMLRDYILKVECRTRGYNCMTDSVEETYDPVDDYRPKILIFSLPRSGSSFLGELFNREENSFYLYEPLHASEALETLPIMQSPNMADHNTVRKLDDLFNCQLKQHDYLFRFISHPDFSNPHFRLMSRVLASPPFCDYHMLPNSTEAEYKDHCHTIDTSELTTLCRSKDTLVIKELMHRLPMYNPKEMENLLEIETLRTIWLVRDPRAIISSMINIGWITKNPKQSYEEVLKATISKVCGLYEQFLITMSFIRDDLKGKLEVLRYEDLVTKPHDAIAQIVRISDGNIDQDTVDWIIKHTQGSSTGISSVDSYSVLSRNSSYAMTSWRRSLGMSHVLFIQQKCNTFMRQLGYKKFWDVNNLMNMARPSFVKFEII